MGKRRTEIKLNKLDFYAYKPSPIHSVFTHRNRVRWTRFLCIKNESIRLGLYVQKPSLIDSVFLHRNQVLDLVLFSFATRRTQQKLSHSLPHSQCVQSWVSAPLSDPAPSPFRRTHSLSSAPSFSVAVGPPSRSVSESQLRYLTLRRRRRRRHRNRVHWTRLGYCSTEPSDFIFSSLHLLISFFLVLESSDQLQFIFSCSY